MPWGVAAAVAGSVVSSALAPDAPSGSSGGSAVGGAAQAVGGVLAAQDAEKFGQQVVQTADPFQQYRSNWAGQLNTAANAAGNPTGLYQQANQGLSNLLSNPSNVLNDPLYKAQSAQGLQTVNRQLAARGQTASGNELTALQDYGTSSANNYMSQLMNQYSGISNQSFAQAGQLSGLSQANLGAAAQAQSNIYGNVNSAYNSAGQGLGQLAGSVGSGIGNAVSGAIGGLAGTGTSNQTGYNGAGGNTFGSQPFGNQGTTSGGLGSGFYDPGTSAGATGGSGSVGGGNYSGSLGSGFYDSGYSSGWF